MRRKAAIGLFLLAGLASPLGCNALSEQECDGLRSEAFVIINEPHTCNDDTECIGSVWPGCIKPISAKNGEKIDAIKQKFDKGECKEPEAANCPETPPEVYCKQGLCVFRYKSATQQP